MAKRIGTLLVFKRGVSRGEAAAALESIAHLLDPAHYGGQIEKDPGTGKHVFVRGTKPRLNEFEEDHGGPTWYIP